jgi:hypothetical protein
VPEVKRYTFDQLAKRNCAECTTTITTTQQERYVLYTDAVKMQRKAFVAGADWAYALSDWQGEVSRDEVDAEAARRYP